MGRRMRVGLLITELGVGGSENALAQLARGLRPDEFEVHVACLFGAEPIGTALRHAGIPVEEFGAPGRLDLRAVGRCRSWMRRRRLDIVHAFLFRANIVSRLAHGGESGPVVINSYRNVGMDSPLQRLLDRATRRGVRRFTAVSRAVRDHLVVCAGIPPERIEVIPNGIDLAGFDREAEAGPLSRSSLGAPAGVPLIGTVGQMRRDRAKGYPTLVEAARLVRDRSPAVFVACGDGTGRAEVETEIDRRGVRQTFRLLGLRRDVPSLLRSIDLYVQASRSEGMPNAILEAMAAGRPVVATAVGGIPEVVEDGVTGVLVPPDRPVEMAEAILSILGSPDRASAMGRAARKRVERDFSAAAMIAAHRHLYLRSQCSRKRRL